MLELFSIASGSSGNCICVGTEQSHVLVDAGVSGKKIENGLHAMDLTCRDLEGILITHEHSDHIAGLGVLARRYQIPIFATEQTITAIKNTKSVGKIEEELFCPICEKEEFQIGDLKVKPIPVSHDAANPVAYKMKNKEKSLAIITDLGDYDQTILEEAKDLDILFLEANHDVNMLQTGIYPYALKQRILGNRGHLSNERCGQLLSSILHDNVSSIMLGHLSKENNYEALAYETVRLEVTMGDNPYRADDFPMYIAKRDTNSQVLRV